MSTKEVSVNLTPGLSFPTLLGLLFIGLKLGGVIAWSWVWVLAPFWIGLVFAFVLLVIFALLVLVFGAAANTTRRRKF